MIIFLKVEWFAKNLGLNEKPFRNIINRFSKTTELLGIWESVHNPNFNYGEFDTIKRHAGLNSYRISIKEWVNKTNAIGLMAKAGRYGGTCAHRDLAFEF